MTEINAKYRYITLCRSLKTYGVTFFLVKVRICVHFQLVVPTTVLLLIVKVIGS